MAITIGWGVIRMIALKPPLTPSRIITAPVTM